MNIPMPPDGFFEKNIHFNKYCLKYKDDPLTITVKADGELLCFPLGEFEPHLPEGRVSRRSEPYGPYKPVHNNKDVLMVYIESVSHKVYVSVIEIREECKP